MEDVDETRTALTASMPCYVRVWHCRTAVWLVRLILIDSSGFPRSSVCLAACSKYMCTELSYTHIKIADDLQPSCRDHVLTLGTHRMYQSVISSSCIIIHKLGGKYDLPGGNRKYLYSLDKRSWLLLISNLQPRETLYQCTCYLLLSAFSAASAFFFVLVISKTLLCRVFTE